MCHSSISMLNYRRVMVIFQKVITKWGLWIWYWKGGSLHRQSAGIFSSVSDICTVNQLRPDWLHGCEPSLASVSTTPRLNDLMKGINTMTSPLWFRDRPNLDMYLNIQFNTLKKNWRQNATRVLCIQIVWIWLKQIICQYFTTRIWCCISNP